MKERVRENSRKKLKEILTFVYSKCKIDSNSSPTPLSVIDIEHAIIEKYPQVDANYRKKIDDTVSNLKFFGLQACKVSLADIADQLFIKRSLRQNTLQ